MPATTSPPNKTSRWQCTVDAYEKLSDMGFLSDGRYELLNGDIVARMPIKIPHAYLIMLLTFALARVAGEEYVLANFSLWIDERNLPAPDLAVTVRPVAELLSREDYVQPSDVRLVVEVSAATLRADLTTKAGLYAQAGIPEYWALDVENRRLFVHRDPGATDGYLTVSTHLPGEAIAPLFAPTAALAVASLFPPQTNAPVRDVQL